MIRPIRIGSASFRDIQVGGYELIDKTRLIEQIMGDVSESLLFPRPRRFGKTFGLSMLKEFFAIPAPGPAGKLPDPDARALFQGLYIESVWDKVAPHFQRHPTVLISFKGMDFSTSEQWLDTLRQRIAQVVREQMPFFGPLHFADQQLFTECLNLQATPFQLGLTLHSMTRWLHRGTGQKAVVLIDDYDAPIQQVWMMAHALNPRVIALLPTEKERAVAQRKRQALLELYKQVFGFFRSFLGSGLMDGDSVYKGIVTGTQHVSRESLFSDYNGPRIRTMLDAQYADAFGFTEAEVKDLFIRQGKEDRLEVARRWYGGYLFGKTTLYNPWSILNTLESSNALPQLYWVNPSEDAQVRQMLRRATPNYAQELEGLLNGTPVLQRLRDTLSLDELVYGQRSLFDLLFFSGYLRADLYGYYDSGEGIYALTIPNQEVRTLFQETLSHILEVSVQRGGIEVQQLIQAILTGNDRELPELLSNLAVHLSSYLEGDPNNSEVVSEGLVLGLCACLEGEYSVRSSRDLGWGRTEVLILPKEPGKPGALLELRSTCYGDSLEKLIRQGERQLKMRLHAKAMRALEVHPLQRWVVAVDGKVLKVKKLRAEK